VNAAQYAEYVGASERTVLRWLKAGELPSATKTPDGRWFIPADAVRQVTSPDMSVTRQGDVVRANGAAAQPASLGEALDRRTALLSLEDASRLLGIPESSIRRHAEQLGAVPWGPRGTLVVPARVVRGLAGL
jgi:predicted DNA-binding transcriptional regulator AlpA